MSNAYVAAAEIIATIKGHKSDEFPDHLDFKASGFQEKINDKLIKDFKKSLKKVLLKDGSELFELWEDPDLLEGYYEDLIDRLS